VSLPDPPSHLDQVARKFWRGVTAELASLGLGFRCERWDVEHVSLLYTRARQAEALMPAGGFYTDEKGAPRRHPAAIEALACRKELRVALEAMGISASGRARLLGSVKPRRADDAEEFFGSATSKYFSKSER
jgi:P27 family predicted phage terminase small subunit